MRALLLVAAACAAAQAKESEYRLDGAFSARIPEDWLVRESWRGDVPGVTFSWVGPAGEHRVLLYKYPKSNPYRVSFEKFVADLEKRASKDSRVQVKARAKAATVYRGLRAPRSAWARPHFDPDEAVLGASGGDFSAKRRLLRCRERGAWRKYAWYREAYGSKKDLELFFKYFSREDGKVVQTCLGAEALRTIEARAKPDPALSEPDDARLEELARAAETAAPKPPEESVYAERASDGFYVFRCQSPPGKQDRLFPAFLRLIATFKPE